MVMNKLLTSTSHGLLIPSTSHYRIRWIPGPSIWILDLGRLTRPPRHSWRSEQTERCGDMAAGNDECRKGTGPTGGLVPAPQVLKVPLQTW